MTSKKNRMNLSLKTKYPEDKLVLFVFLSQIGKIFYLYVSPVVGGLLLIGGVIFIVLWCMKRKRLNKEKNIGKPKEEIVQTGESQNLKEEKNVIIS